MKAAKRFKGLILICLLCGIGILMSACSPSESTGTGQSASGQQTTGSADSPTPVSLAVAEEPEAIDEEETDECLECHFDKDRLIQTMDPVVEVESEDSGEG